METGVRFRWLGVAGVEIAANGEVLVVDPYLTRFPFWRQWIGAVQPNTELIAKLIPRCDYVLVSHSHHDHVMDVPSIVSNTGAVAMGSPNTCRLLEIHGIAAEQIRRIDTGDTLTLGSFQVQVLLAEHMPLPLEHLFNGPLRPNLRPPLRVLDYRMDFCFSFRIEAAGHSFLNWRSGSAEGALPADVLFVSPMGSRAFYQSLLGTVRPRIVVPVHWDNFYRPLSVPIRPMFSRASKLLPPLRRLQFARFEEMMAEIAPHVRLLVPEALRTYEMDALRR